MEKLTAVEETVDKESRDDAESDDRGPVFNPIQCLDHGFVRLVDYMGDDDAIVQAARVSYGRGTKKKSDDRGLIRYLMRHSHTTPFEMVEFKFHVKLPIFVARQWIRHRTANVNEYSGRYSVMEDEFYVPRHEDIHFQSKTNKQGRDTIEPPQDLRAEYLDSLTDVQRKSYTDYMKFVEADLARELARINLPLSLYTQWYWKIDLHNLFHFMRLRADAHAQFEIRVYADAIAEIVKQITPIAYEAFEDYTLNAVKFSGPELNILKSAISSVEITESTAEQFGISKRELRELAEKLDRVRKNKN